jgi:type I restriction enzyme S subunit
MNETPANWETITFGELNRFVSSSINPSISPDELFTLYSVPSYPQGVPERLIGRSIGSTKQLVTRDDVLVCKINPRINRIWRVFDSWEETQIASSEWIVMRSSECVAKYLQYYFKSPDFRELICADVTGVGGSLTRAQPRRVDSFPVPIPPVAEQKRIADKLDSLLSRVDGCRERLDRVTAILRRFRQSVLSAAISGKLTEDWREANPTKRSASELIELIAAARANTAYKQPKMDDEGIDAPERELPLNWTWCRVRDIADVRLGGTPSRKIEEFWGGEIAWVSSGEVSNCRIASTNEYITDLGLSESNAKIYPTGTVLIAMIGEGKTRGQSAILDVPATTNQNSAGLVFDTPHIEPEYVWLWALSEYERNRNIGRGGNQPALNGAKVRALPVPLPPFDEQKEIVRRVMDIFLMVELLESRFREGRSCVDSLTRAFLAKAFRGALVPQDPNDEPASVLLERIRGQRQTTPTIKPKQTAKRKTRALRKKAVMTKSRFDDDVQDKPYLAGFLKDSKKSLSAEDLFKKADLPLVDFYKQLDFEVKQKLIVDRDGQLEAA